MEQSDRIPSFAWQPLTPLLEFATEVPMEIVYQPLGPLRLGSAQLKYLINPTVQRSLTS
jgi:hypothetical protein